MLGIDWLSASHILENGGNAALWITLAIIFAECGLLLGFFLPGDTLLFSVGVFIANDIVPHSIWLACTVLAVGAIAGNVVGYEIGRAAGPAILASERQKMLKPKHIERTEAFFERFGTPAIILARFVPIVRTVITVVAGVARMDRRRYFILSTIGGVLWVFGVTLTGYFLGGIPFVRDHIEPHLDLVILAVVALSVIPAAGHLYLEHRRTKRRKREERNAPTAPAGPAQGSEDARQA